MTLGGAAAARVRFIVWCKGCRYQVEPDPAEVAERYGPETPVPDWHKQLVCSRCGSRYADWPGNRPSTMFWHSVRMSDEHILALQQADQARTDLAVLESELQIIMGQVARLPTRADLAKAPSTRLYQRTIYGGFNAT